MIVPLWTPENTTLHSSVFEVHAGKAVSLFATGLEQWKVREDSAMPQTPQMICVSKLLRQYKDEAAKQIGPAMTVCDCGFVFEATWPVEIQLIEEVVRTRCAWSLTRCNNFAILAVPGLYRLHLNDDTAIGKAQVYAEQMDIQDIPPQLTGIFFG